MTSFVLPHQLLAWLFDATIKGSVVILLVAALQLAIGRRLQARWRHALWLLVLVRLLVPAAPESRWSLFNLFPMTAAVGPQLHFDARVPPELTGLPLTTTAGDVRFLRVTNARFPPMRWLLGIWLTGALLLTFRIVVASLRMRHEVNRAWRGGGRVPWPDIATGRIACPPQLRSAVARMRIVESDVVRTPALHGLLAPILLLPRGMSAAFTADELRHVVLHELWHVRRLDVAVNWLLSIVQAIHWFNPFVWFATSRIKEERELACDELTLSCLEEEERFSYGTTILKLLERFRAAAPVPALVGIVDHKQKMKRRLTMITSYRSGRRFSAVFVAVLAVVSIVAFTDARGGERRFLKELDPSAVAAMESLHQRVTLDLTNATFSELLSAVGGGARMAVTQSADVATSDIQQARFTLHAENVPAHAVLMEALAPFKLSVEPTANGATITKEPNGDVLLHHKLLAEHEAATPGNPHSSHRERIIIINGDHDGKLTDHPPVELERLHGDGTVGHEVFVHKSAKSESSFGPDGKMHRELTINIEENGVKSDGKLTLEISSPSAVK
ncbi:MAG: hypothetical protein JWN02_2065 [Acidobacteria bacterium]|nr:hypothetical protein [Acidobacteriota bacterium]